MDSQRQYISYEVSESDDSQKYRVRYIIGDMIRWVFGEKTMEDLRKLNYVANTATDLQRDIQQHPSEVEEGKIDNIISALREFSLLTREYTGAVQEIIKRHFDGDVRKYTKGIK